jgi:hypothetical protein
VRARVVPGQAFRSFVASVGLTYLAGAMSVSLEGVHRWLWERFPNGAHVWVSDPGWSELPAGRDGRLASGVVVAACIAAAVVPWLLMFWPTRAREVEEGDGEVRIGPTRIAACDVTGASVAPDGRGASVAIGRGDTATFLELDRIEDARRLLGTLGRRFPTDGRVAHRLPRGSAVFVQAIFAAIAILFAGFAAATLGAWQWEMLEVPLGAAPAFFVLTLPLVILRGGKPIPVAWDRATELNPTRALDRSPLERHIRRHLEGRLREDPDAPRVRVDLLQRGGGESSKAWLARIDALRSADAYRGESLPKDVLFEIVADEKLAIDVRVAAARLLSRRDGESAEAIARGIEAEEVRTRLLAVLADDEASAAADALEAVGPLFKTG